MKFDRYLAAAVEVVKKTIEGGGVVIIVPPGSVRETKILIHEGTIDEDNVLLYEEFHRRGGRVERPLRLKER